MKNCNLILFVISFTIILLTTIEVNATNPAGSDDILMVPKAAYAPTIDGHLDSIWKNVANNKLLICYYPPQNWLDMFSSFRVMWDDNYFYIFTTIQDEIIYTTHANYWENDVVEFLIDGDNSKNSQQQGLDNNDVHWHFNFGKAPHCSNNAIDFSSLNCVSLKTDIGWNLEIAFKFLNEMTFNANAYSIFEVSI